MDHEKVISKFGGTAKVAELCECSPQAVSQWFGKDPKTGQQRFIPNARLLFLKAIRPDIFRCRPTTQKEAAHG